MKLHQAEKLLHNKRNNQYHEETTHKLEKIFAYYTSGMELISKTHMELQQLNSKETMGKGPKETFFSKKI